MIIQNNIQNLAKNRLPASATFVPRLEDLIMFKSKEDGSWYRGIVTKIIAEKERMTVFAPDYGFSEKVSISPESAQPLFCEELSKVKYFAVPCEVDGEGEDAGQLAPGARLVVSVVRIVQEVKYVVNISTIAVANL